LQKFGIDRGPPARLSRRIKSRGNPEQLGDEGSLCPHLRFLSSIFGTCFFDLRHCLEAARVRCAVPEAGKAEPRTGQPFETSVVLAAVRGRPNVLAEEALGRFPIRLGREQEVDDLALAINRSIQTGPAASRP
jgi:hypothetical protein